MVFDRQERYVVEMRVYCLKEDLFSLIPLKGDLHVHSFRSDGLEAPEIVAANYRKAGFDFMTISDHELMYPSREAIECYQDAALDLLIVPGEEVHTPDNKVHVVNFGGEISVNDLYRQDREGYYREVEQIRQGLEGIDQEDSFQYAVSNGEGRPRVYGPFRIASYVEFLINEYFPLHDELCYEEGRVMKDYVNGAEGAKEALEALHGRTKEMIRKYFGKL